MRKAFIAGNWKMHKTVAEAVALAKELVKAVGNEKNKTVLVAPPFTALAAVSEALKGSGILLGAQNMGPEISGAHTGEVSVKMLLDLGVSHVILGHSERRHVYAESNELVNRKVSLALAEGMDVILCVGETETEREKGITEEVVGDQVTRGLALVSEADMKKVVIAYEPVWAIGTGRTATDEQAQEVHAFIRSLMGKMWNPDFA
ncbi:MAG: triose-phosphate isomerase, partial [Spirochaetaceae bacterium]